MRRAGVLLCWAAAAGLAGCAAVAPPSAAGVQAAAAEALGLTEADRFAAEGLPQPAAEDLHWWRRFDDPALAAWVEQALQRAPDTAAAAARVAQAQALLAQARAQRGPRLAAQAQGTLEGRRNAGERVLQPSMGLVATWDTDLWGGLSAAEAAAEAGLQRSRALDRSARLTQAALTASAYVEWRAAQADGTALAQARVLQQESARIAGIRVEAGLAPRLDLDRARAEVAQIEADAAAAAARQRQALAALQALAGTPPGLQRGPAGAAAAAFAGPVLPALREAGPLPRPLDLLRLRPDMQAAEAALWAAAAESGVAWAALRPALRLDGRLLLATAGGGGALELGTAAVGALLDAVLFDGGARQAGADAAQARVTEAAEAWRGTALQALQQVELALAAAEGSARRVAALEQALAAREQAVAQAQTLYTAGLAGFLDLLDAQRSALAARRAWLQAKADATLAAVAQFQAVGLVAPAGA